MAGLQSLTHHYATNNEDKNSSIENKKLVFKDKFKYCRFYFLPFAQNENCVCGKCLDTGALREKKSREDILRIFKKAKKADYSAISFPCYFLFQPDALSLMKFAHGLGLEVFIQISVDAWISEYQPTLKLLMNEGLLLNVILGRPGVAENEFIDYIEKKAHYVYYTLVGENFSGLAQYVSLLPQTVINELHFYFPLNPLESDRVSAVEHIHRSLKQIAQKVRKKGKYLNIRGPKGVDIYEPHIPPDRSLEPELDPILQSQVMASDQHDPDKEIHLDISVIIPTYNSKNYLKNVLRHLFRQDLNPEKYEVIVIDDGSDDGTQSELTHFLQPFFKKNNFSYLFFSRITPRQRGDSQFRAGIARNAGVKCSRGRILLFLDADMLIPSHYLSDLIKKMKTYDVIQGKRLFLNESISNELTSYNLIDTEIDTYPEDPYWGAFQKTIDWNSLHNHWKYTCTHSLAVKSVDFKKLGWFRKTFLYYGFEDVDLGYRLAKDEARFHLNDIPLYHLHPPTDQSEYDRSLRRRQLILARTCRIFFHHSLDESIYQDFRNLMTPLDHSHFHFHFDLPKIDSSATIFWFRHQWQMTKWRWLWFIHHPAPRSSVLLTTGLLRRIYWSYMWPAACWMHWRLKVVGSWCYWRFYAFSNFLKWKTWGSIKWKVWSPFKWGLLVPMYWRLRSLFNWMRWKILESAYWKGHECVSWTRWKIWHSLKWKILWPAIYRIYHSPQQIYRFISGPFFWFLFDLSLPLRKPFYFIRYQYQKRILRINTPQKKTDKNS